MFTIYIAITFIFVCMSKNIQFVYKKRKEEKFHLTFINMYLQSACIFSQYNNNMNILSG